MTPTPSLARPLWLAVLVVAAGAMLGLASQRVHRVRAVTDAVPVDLVADAASPTGYAGGVRRLVLPDTGRDSAQWIIRTEQMLASGRWRVHRIDYENAPDGREVVAAAPYHWWLAAVAWGQRAATGSSPGASVEAAALYANPLLHLLLLAGTAAFAWWRFGGGAAAATGLGLALMFPLAAAFPAGAPDDLGLGVATVLGSVLSLLAGLRTAASARRWFVVAGIIGGIGLWLSPALLAPVLAGLAAGVAIAVAVTRHAALAAAPWRHWSVAGAVGSLVAYLAEYAPGKLGGWQLRALHPLYGLAWLGLGAALAVGLPALQRHPTPWNRTRLATAAFAVLALAALPVAMFVTRNRAFLTTDLAAFQLPGVIGATGSVFAWLGREDLRTTAVCTLLPLLLFAPVAWRAIREPAPSSTPALAWFALGPLAVALGFACWQAAWWPVVDVLLIAATCATLPAFPVRGQAIAIALAACALAPGWARLLPPRGDLVLEPPELAALIERDLAHWLAKRAGPQPGVVLAPPSETAALAYYGSLRGLGTLAPENRAGITATVRLLSARTAQEAQTLMARRGITHLVLPSWDATLGQYVQAGGVPLESTFLGGLRKWELPAWLRPVPYELPAVSGYENQSVAVFEVMEEQGDTAALCRLALYFVEMGRNDYAAAIEQSLRPFSSDLAVLATRAEVQAALNQPAAFAETVRSLTGRLNAGADRTLSWERRVGLAGVLAQARQAEFARAQTQRCFTDATEARLRALSNGALFRLLALGRAFQCSFREPRLQALALDLLPADWRAKL